MELALTIIAALGLLLFFFSYLGYVRAGFKYNLITGIISALPVLNIVTLPALWNKVSKKFFMGLLGLIIFSASWFFGANKGVDNLLLRFNGGEDNIGTVQQTISGNTGTTIIKPAPNISPNEESSAGQAFSSDTPPVSSAIAPFSNTRQRVIDESKMGSLPAKALYIMTFETIPVNQITALKNRIVKIKTNRESYEGRILAVNNGTVIIQSAGKQELPIGNIKELQLMTRKALP